MKLDHVLILARDVAAMRRFFVEAIGLEDGPRPPFPFPGHWLYSEGVPLIHLAAAEATSAQSDYLGINCTDASGPIDHIALTGAEMQPLIERLDRAGVDYAVRYVPLDHTRQVFVASPEGLKIEMQFPETAVAGADPKGF